MIILQILLGSLYEEKPHNAARIWGAIGSSQTESDLIPAEPIAKLYYVRADVHARGVLGDSTFEALFAEGQKMSLDEALDLALKTVEEV